MAISTEDISGMAESLKSLEKGFMYSMRGFFSNSYSICCRRILIAEFFEKIIINKKKRNLLRRFQLKAASLIPRLL